MKTLYLVRHAKADSNDDKLPDFERPLTKRGIENANEMAGRFLNKNPIPELIISSPAMRALTTAQIFAKKFEINNTQIEKDPEIYESEVSDLLRIINSQTEQINSLMIFGHNPTFFDLVNYLNPTSVHDFPTCSIAKLEFQKNKWNLMSKSSAKLIYFDFPNNK